VFPGDAAKALDHHLYGSIRYRVRAICENEIMSPMICAIAEFLKKTCNLLDEAGANSVPIGGTHSQLNKITPDIDIAPP